ncbi:MAG: hypothetical protein IJ222_10590 [Bacteroidales bacterium]|nr:hypothetical protein [Bacteroidales bacterium]
MKAFKFIVPLMAAALLACGCTKEYNTYGSKMLVRDYNVVPAQWQRNMGDNEQDAFNYLYVDLKNEDITQDVVDAGAVQAFVWNIYDSFNNLGAWNTLPYVIPIEIIQTDGGGNTTTAIVAENMRFEWEKGKVTLVIQDLDGFDPEDMVSTVSVRVCTTL